MRLYVPEIGDSLKLESDWSFKLYHEHRNQKMLEHFGTAYNRGYRTEMEFNNVTIKAGSVLKVDRIYIRKGASDHSSISFYLITEGSKKSIRFWAKLDDCNKIDLVLEQEAKEYKKSKLSWSECKIVPTETNSNIEYNIDETVKHLQIKDLNGKTIFNVTCRYDIEKTSHTRKYPGIFSNTYTYYTVKRTNMVYELYKDRVLLNTFKSYASMKKAALNIFETI